MPYINDGYTLKGVLHGFGPFKDINFRYRLASYDDIGEYQASAKIRPTLDAAVKLLIGGPSPRMVSWDAKPLCAPHDANTVVLDKDNLGRLPAIMVEEAISYVCGYRADAQDIDLKN
jgi:hypothetical protein